MDPDNKFIQIDEPETKQKKQNFLDDEYNGNNEDYVTFDIPEEKPERKVNWLFWILLVMLILLFLVFGWILFRNIGNNGEDWIEKLRTAANECVREHADLRLALENSERNQVFFAEMIERNCINEDYLVNPATNEAIGSCNYVFAVVSDGLITYPTVVTNLNCEDNETNANLKPIVELNGNAEMELRRGANFNDPGATARDYNGQDITDRIQVENNIDNTTIGCYDVVYSVTNDRGVDAEAAIRRVCVIAPPPGSGNNNAAPRPPAPRPPAGGGTTPRPTPPAPTIRVSSSTPTIAHNSRARISISITDRNRITSYTVHNSCGNTTVTHRPNSTNVSNNFTTAVMTNTGRAQRTCTITVRATNSQNRSASRTTIFRVNAASSAPGTCRIATPAPSRWVNSSVNVVATGTNIRQWNLGNGWRNTRMRTFMASPNTHINQSITVQGRDLNGRIVNCGTTRVRIDTVRPTTPTLPARLCPATGSCTWQTATDYPHGTIVTRGVFLWPTNANRSIINFGSTDAHSGISHFEISATSATTGFVRFNYDSTNQLYFMTQTGNFNRWIRAVDNAGNVSIARHYHIRIQR